MSVERNIPNGASEAAAIDRATNEGMIDRSYLIPQTPTRQIGERSTVSHITKFGENLPLDKSGHLSALSQEVQIENPREVDVLDLIRAGGEGMITVELPPTPVKATQTPR